MEDLALLRYSDEAQKARSQLYSCFNDLNIYVEDEDKEFFYETLFKKILGSQFKIVAVFSCGGKTGVIDNYCEFGSIYNGVKNFYLVDGDFDRILCPETMIVNDCFFYLDAYNIESYLISKEPVLTYAKGLLKCVDSDLERIVDFDGWLTRIVSEAKELFLFYCYIMKFHPEEPSVSRSPYLFIDSSTGFKSNRSEVKEYFDSICSHHSDVMHQISLLESECLRINGGSYFNLICGKFLLASLRSYLSSISKRTIRKDDFEWFLLTNVDVEKFKSIKTACLNLFV